MLIASVIEMQVMQKQEEKYILYNNKSKKVWI